MDTDGLDVAVNQIIPTDSAGEIGFNECYYFTHSQIEMI
ncbi:MAG: hypothetical protein ACJA09_002821 [Alcanivorax sp.]